MKIVEFNNGKFAICVFNIYTIIELEKQYIDKETTNPIIITWGKKDRWIKNCLFNSLEEAKLFIKERNKKNDSLDIKKIHKI